MTALHVLAAPDEEREADVTDHVRSAVGDLRGVGFDGPYTHRFKGIEEKVLVYRASRPD